GRGRAVSVREDGILLLLVSVVGIALGVYAAVSLQVFPSGDADGLRRAYFATQVLFGFEPRLSNMGFTLPPLPTLLQLPVVLAIPQTAYSGVSGVVVSAIAAGVALVALNRALALYVPGRRWRYLFLATYQLNPLVLYLTISGFDLMIALAFMMTAWLALQRIFFEEPLPIVQVAVLGSALAAAFLCQFDLLIAGVFMLGTLVLLVYVQKRPNQWPFTEGVTVGALTPFGYVVIAWIFFNELIVRDPFYFLTASGAWFDQVRLAAAGSPLLQELFNSPSNAFDYVLRAANAVSPAFLVLGTVSVAPMLIKRDLFLLSLVLTILVYPAAQLVLLVEGYGTGFSRMFTYMVPLTVVLAGYVTRPQYVNYPDWFPRSLPRMAVLAVLIGSALFSWSRLSEPDLVKTGELQFLAATAGLNAGYPVVTDLETADHLRELFKAEPDALVRVDDLAIQNVVLFSGHPGHFITPTSAGFSPFVNNPSSRVRYFMTLQDTPLLG
ncbi:MAG: hypothetical protein AAB289_10390, partial [Chloroflexota bacterium]